MLGVCFLCFPHLVKFLIATILTCPLSLSCTLSFTSRLPWSLLTLFYVWIQFDYLFLRVNIAKDYNIGSQNSSGLFSESRRLVVSHQVFSGLVPSGNSKGEHIPWFSPTLWWGHPWCSLACKLYCFNLCSHFAWYFSSSFSSHGFHLSVCLSPLLVWTPAMFDIKPSFSMTHPD